MLDKFTHISEKEWNEQYKPVFFDEENDEYGLSCSWPETSTMIEFATKLADKPEDWYRHVWTSVDGDDGGIYMYNGPRHVNRISWFFTSKPWGDDVPADENSVNIEVLDEEQEII